MSPAKVLTSDEREALLSSVATLSPHAYPFVMFLAECGGSYSVRPQSGKSKHTLHFRP